MRAYNIFNKIQNSILSPLAICSVLLLIAEVSTLIISKNINENLLSGFNQAVGVLISFVFCYFVSFTFIKSNKRLFVAWSMICFAIFTLTSGIYSNVLISIIFALGLSFVINNFNKVQALIFSLILSILVGLILEYSLPLANSTISRFALFISKSGHIGTLLFGFFKSMFDFIGVDSFKELFYYKSYGCVSVIDNELIMGVKQLFIQGISSDKIAKYLSGHAFVLFSVIGVTLSLSDELKGVQRLILWLVSISSVISGNLSLILIFIFFESWRLLFSVSIISALGYIATYLLQIQIGYVNSGGVIEILLNIDKPVYLFLGGLVFVAIGYFVSKYNVLKYGLSDSYNIYYPTRFNTIVKALGGISNIVAIKGNNAEVRNIKLVNELELDCEIKENIVKVNNDEILDLGGYLN